MFSPRWPELLLFGGKNLVSLWGKLVCEHWSTKSSTVVWSSCSALQHSPSSHRCGGGSFLEVILWRLCQTTSIVIYSCFFGERGGAHSPARWLATHLQLCSATNKIHIKLCQSTSVLSNQRKALRMQKKFVMWKLSSYFEIGTQLCQYTLVLTGCSMQCHN